MGQKYGGRAPQQNRMYTAPEALKAQAPSERELRSRPTYSDYKTAPGSQMLYNGSLIDPNRGDPNKRVAAKLEVKAPVAPAAPATPAGPTPQQIAAQQQAQQAAAIAAQQAAFWAQHDAAQRMKNGG